MERFRPNVVIDGVEAYDEDRMHELRAGPVTLRIVKPCTRCSITTTDQQRGAVDGVEPLQTLKEYRFDPKLRGVAFGQNAIIVDGVGESSAAPSTVNLVRKWLADVERQRVRSSREVRRRARASAAAPGSSITWVDQRALTAWTRKLERANANLWKRARSSAESLTR